MFVCMFAWQLALKAVPSLYPIAWQGSTLVFVQCSAAGKTVI